MKPADPGSSRALSMPTPVARSVLLVWVLSHILYPVWFPLSGSLRAAATVFAMLCAMAAAIALWLRPYLIGRASDAEHDDTLADLLTPPADGMLWMIAAAVVVIRCYPLTLPIHLWEGGDEALHMGVPALPFKLLARHLPLPYPFAVWASAAIALYFRRELGAWVRAAYRSALEPRAAAVACAATLAASYFATAFCVIRYFLHSGHPTFARDLLRYPPLCKWIRFPIYAVFGVSNLTGRLPEFLFFLATGLLLFRLFAEFRSRAAGRVAAAVFWFFPPVAYYGVRGSQTEGEVFFYVLVCYLYARWALRGRQAALYWAALAVGAGSMYRYTVPLLAGVLAVLSLLPGRATGAARGRPPLRIVAECAGIIAVMTVPWMAAFFLNKSREYSSLGGHSRLEKLAAPALSLPHAASWPIAALLVLGLLSALWRRKDGLQRYVIAWVVAYYLFISMDLGEVVRLDIPMYAALIVLAVDSLFAAFRSAAWAQGFGLAAAAYLFFVSTIVAAPPMEPRFALRHGLRTEYVPVTAAARELDRMPDGTRLLAVDCSQGCFTINLPRPRALEWTVVDSKSVPSIDALRDLCAKGGIQVVMYAAGTTEAFGMEENPSLFRAFQRASGWLTLRKEYVLGENRIVFKNVTPP